jgi:RNA methyltransferase, TrmH family
MKRITSPDNTRFKGLLKLAHSSRERRLQGLSLLDGVHLVQAYHEHIGLPEQLVISETGAERREIQTLLDALSQCSPLVLNDTLFKQLSTVDTPTGVLGLIKTPRSPAMPAHIDSCVMLEDIQDPGNLGSILRSSAAAGIKHIFLSKHAVHAWSPRVLRAGMGAHFMLCLHEQCDLSEVIRHFQGKVIATRRNAGRSIFDTDLSGQVAFLFGSEGSGLSPALAAAAQDTIAIPMPGKVESLNVAAAAAICLFERIRQLQKSHNQ